jgi:hypothetical protein
MLAAIIIFLIVATPIATHGAPADNNVDPRIEAAKTVVRDRLKDPDSAQFKNVVVIQNSVGETTICGLYNARNSFGGYIGFKQFGVSGNKFIDSSTELDELERFGCLGPDKEKERRIKEAEKALSDKFRAEAVFNCRVIWTLMENHIRYGQSVESVLDAAMVAIVNRASEKGKDIAPTVLDTIRNQYKDNLIKTTMDMEAVKSISRGDGIFDLQFNTTCAAMTIQLFEKQSKLK